MSFNPAIIYTTIFIYLANHPLNQLSMNYGEDGADPSCVPQEAGYKLGRSAIYCRTSTKKATIHTHIHLYGQFRLTSWPNLKVFRLWEEIGSPRGNLYGLGKTTQRTGPVIQQVQIHSLLAVRWPACGIFFNKNMHTLVKTLWYKRNKTFCNVPLSENDRLNKEWWCGKSPSHHYALDYFPITARPDVLYSIQPFSPHWQLSQSFMNKNNTAGWKNVKSGNKATSPHGTHSTSLQEIWH